MNKNEKILTPLIVKFTALGEQLRTRKLAKNAVAELENVSVIDDMIAEFFKADLDEGEKLIKDTTHRGTRSIKFIYDSDDHCCHVEVKVVTVHGNPKETEFTHKARFTKKKH